MEIIISEPTVEYSEIVPARCSIDGRTGRIDGFRRLKCLWEDRLELIKQLLGSIEAVDEELIVYSPHQFPMDGLERCLARSADWQAYYGGVDKDATQPLEVQQCIASTEWAEVDVNYSTHVDNIREDSTTGIWRRENIRGVAEMMLMPNNDNLAWKDPGEVFVKTEGDEIPGYLIHRIEWTYTRKYPGEPPIGLANLTNYVNSVPITSPTYGQYFDIETLKFITPQFNVERDTKGNVITEMTLAFHYQKEGWNLFPRQVGGLIQFEPIYNLVTGIQVKPFLPYDFSGWII